MASSPSTSDANKRNNSVEFLEKLEDKSHSSEVQSEIVPPLTSLFAFQAAGHRFGQGKTKLGLLKHEDGSILKPLSSPRRGPREHEFYEKVFDPNCKDPIILQLRTLIPCFLGTFEASVTGKTVTFLKLENLTSKFPYPSVLDLKMGVVTSDPLASPEVVEKERLKYKQTKCLGFCIPGMQIYNRKTGEYTIHDKEYGKNLNAETVRTAIHQYLCLETAYHYKVLQSFLQKLYVIRNWFECQRYFAFYASSLLFIYNGSFQNVHSQCSHCESSVNESNCSCKVPLNRIQASERISPSESQEPVSQDFKAPSNKESLSNSHDTLLSITELRMIDFAHVFPTTEEDNNYLFGLRNIISLFESFLQVKPTEDISS